MTAIVIGVFLSSRRRWLVGPGRWNVLPASSDSSSPPSCWCWRLDRYGYDLKEQLMTLAGGDGADAANLYRLLRQLELEGIVRSSWDTGGSGPARRVYRLTVVGRRLLDEWANELRRLEGTT